MVEWKDGRLETAELKCCGTCTFYKTIYSGIWINKECSKTGRKCKYYDCCVDYVGKNKYPFYPIGTGTS